MNPNGAETLYGQIPGAFANTTNWDLLTEVYDYVIENYGADWGWTPDDDQVDAIRSDVVNHHNVGRWSQRGKVIAGWFENWYISYPYLDEIAIERAMDFDHDVWPNLTARERYEVIQRLANHPDPWASQDSISQSGGLPGEVGIGRNDQPLTQSNRASNWLQDPWIDRKPLLQAVGDVKRRMASDA